MGDEGEDVQEGKKWVRRYDEDGGEARGGRDDDDGRQS